MKKSQIHVHVFLFSVHTVLAAVLPNPVQFGPPRRNRMYLPLNQTKTNKLQRIKSSDRGNVKQDHFGVLSLVYKIPTPPRVVQIGPPRPLLRRSEPPRFVASHSQSSSHLQFGAVCSLKPE